MSKSEDWFLCKYAWDFTEKCDSRRCLEFGAWVLIGEEEGEKETYGKISDF